MHTGELQWYDKGMQFAMMAYQQLSIDVMDRLGISDYYSIISARNTRRPYYYILFHFDFRDNKRNFEEILKFYKMLNIL